MQVNGFLEINSIGNILHFKFKQNFYDNVALVG